MFIIKWANGKGHTLVITPSEVAVLEQVIQDAKRTTHGESRDFDIDISPILDVTLSAHTKKEDGNNKED